MSNEQKKCLLVIDDIQMTVDMAVKSLHDNYEILTAESGEEGFALLSENRNRIDLILLDIILPRMSGFDFMEKMKSEKLSRIPVIIMTADNEPQKEVQALKNGAADFVRKPLYPEILKNRIQNVLMRHQMEYDALTGLYNRSQTFQKIKEMIKKNPGQKYAFLRYDIDNFSFYNSSMGEAEGNRLLLYGTAILRKAAEDNPTCVYGRVDADVFCMCEVYEPTLMEKHIEELTKNIQSYRRDYRIESSVGICIFDASELSIERVYTKATLAAHTCKGIFDKQYACYEEWMEANLSEEQDIINEMMGALELGQFVPYFQPKYDLESDTPSGAEALVRWMHPTKGMISPSKFIPIFEKNGFIAKLDYYMWESVCGLLKKWKENNMPVHPVSVNISRVSMYNPELDKLLLDLIDKYGLTPNLLQLEITESAYMTNPDLMKKTIQNLQQFGFTILMDDFGSGYSSLNTLKEIKVDILKVDMEFLPDSDTVERSEKILSSVIRMAGWLGIPTIAEGVETETQRDFLKGIGCDYVQGYYYAKPMNIAEFEALLSTGGEIFGRENDKQYSTAVWSSDKKVNEILAGIQLPVGILEYSSSKVDIVRVNHFFGETFWKDFRRNISNEDFGIIHITLETAVRQGVGEGEFAYALPSGKLKYYRMKVKRLEKGVSASLLCVIVIDISAEKLYGKQLLKLDKMFPPTKRAKMLVVDDTKLMREMVHILFEDTYDIYEAENGKEALEILNENKDEISIILLDMMMPIMDGRTFLVEKNKIDDMDNIPVIVMSADSDADLQLDMLALGVNDYITKPFDSRIFKQKVENAIMYAKRFVKIRNEYERMLAEEVEVN